MPQKFNRKMVNREFGKSRNCVICGGEFTVTSPNDTHTRETCYKEECTRTLISRRSKNNLPFGKESGRCMQCGRLKKDCGHE